MEKAVIIMGSARSQGNTRKVVDLLNKKQHFELIDLNAIKFSGYDYAFNNQGDDFIPLISRLLNEHNLFVFATPVYWYSMSGLLKNFIDRLSDLLGPHKEIGRKFRNKNLAVLSCSGANDLIKEFEVPFRETAKYLGMNYKGHLHTWVIDNKIPTPVETSINLFRSRIIN